MLQLLVVYYPQGFPGSKSSPTREQEEAKESMSLQHWLDCAHSMNEAQKELEVPLAWWDAHSHQHVQEVVKLTYR